MSEARSLFEVCSHWLARSGIVAPNGGVYDGYDTARRVYPRLYSEITGYAVSVFLRLAAWTGEAAHLERARRSGDYLCKLQRRSGELGEGAVAHCVPHGSTRPCDESFTFDAGMILQGLCELAACEGDARYVQAAHDAARWLLGFQEKDGGFRARRRLGGGDRYQVPTFESDYGCLHVKLAVGLLRAADLTGDGSFAAAARLVCEWGLGLQAPDGAFWANVRRTHVFAHAHCYATEGLLFAAHRLREPRYARAAEKAGRWLLQAQDDQGALRQYYKGHPRGPLRWRVECLAPALVSDATAQAVRIWRTLDAQTGDPAFREGAERALRYLQSVQIKRPDEPRINGALWYRIRPVARTRWHGPMVYSWPVMFALAASRYASDVALDETAMCEALF
ncbi:MAG: hypothetical protein ACE5OS_00495 [Anaerolineae bacterium]